MENGERESSAVQDKNLCLIEKLNLCGKYYKVLNCSQAKAGTLGN